MQSDLKPADKVTKVKPRAKGARKPVSALTDPSVNPTDEKSLKSVRQSKLEKARRLLEDADYPSDEVIESVADLLARSWQHDRKMRDGSGG